MILGQLTMGARQTKNAPLQLDDDHHFRVVYEHDSVHLFVVVHRLNVAHHFVVINCTILSPFFLYFASKLISTPLWQEQGLLAQLSSWNNIKKQDDSERQHI